MPTCSPGRPRWGRPRWRWRSPPCWSAPGRSRAPAARAAPAATCSEAGTRTCAWWSARPNGATSPWIRCGALEEEIGLAPYEARRKLFCIRGAETLNEAAASALLKTLEEPPAHATLVLAAIDPAALPATIRSRCQQVALQPVPAAAIAAGLIGAHAIEPARAHALAALARGCPGWAIRALDDREVAERASAAIELAAGLARGSRYRRLTAVEAWLGKGSFLESRERGLQLLALLESYWRDALLLAQMHGDDRLRAHLVGSGADHGWQPQEAVRALIAVQETAARLDGNVAPRLALEHLMLTMPRAKGGAGAGRG